MDMYIPTHLSAVLHMFVQLKTFETQIVYPPILPTIA